MPRHDEVTENGFASAETPEERALRKLEKKRRKEEKKAKKEKKHKDKGERKKEKKEKKSKDGKASRKDREKKKRSREDDDDKNSASDSTEGEIDHNGTERAAQILEKEVRREAVRQAAAGQRDRGQNPIAKLNAEKLKASENLRCQELVNKMRVARMKDQQALEEIEKMSSDNHHQQRGVTVITRVLPTPINRVLMVEETTKFLVSVHLHEKLVEHGVLDELCHWMADKKTNTLAPLDLRSAALDALLEFALEGVVGGKRVPHKNQFKKDELVDDLQAGLTGISRQQLQSTDLGWATNFLRQHPDETVQNRAKATRLLERFSRLFGGDDRVGGGSKREPVKWKTYGAENILPPYETLQSSAELFIKSHSQVDPRDPMSYHKAPPHRPPQAYIAHAGYLSGEKRRVGRDGSEESVHYE